MSECVIEFRITAEKGWNDDYAEGVYDLEILSRMNLLENRLGFWNFYSLSINLVNHL